MKTAAEQMIFNRALVYDIRVPLGNAQVFYILEVDRHRHDAFSAAMATRGREICLHDYGAVLHHGIGEPPADLKEKLHYKYGMYAELSVEGS